ncbi:unnamed protein product, partial [Nesidiocoris tenuis]
MSPTGTVFRSTILLLGRLTNGSGRCTHLANQSSTTRCQRFHEAAQMALPSLLQFR